MRSIIILLSMIVSFNAFAKPWVAIGTGCNDNKRAYDTQAKCEAGETGPGSCEDYGSKVAACKTAIEDAIAQREAARANRLAAFQNALDNWDTLTNAQKQELVKRLLQYVLNSATDG